MRPHRFTPRPALVVALPLLVFSCLTTIVVAQVPDPNNSYASADITESVSIFMLPNGMGWDFTQAMTFGGGTVDATISVTLLDSGMNPVVGYAAEDISFCDPVLCMLSLCPGGHIADGPTDAMGQTTFSNPLNAGGSGVGATIAIGTWPTPEFPLVFQESDMYRFNSPDINGDRVVNLSDVANFAVDYYGAYDYRSDFFWDNSINLSDLVLFAQGMGASCP